MIEAYEKQYQESKKEYDTLSTSGLTDAKAQEVIDRYWKAHHDLDGAKTADNFNKREHRFW